MLGPTPRVSDSVDLKLIISKLKLGWDESKLEFRVPTLAVDKTHASYIWS